MSGLGPPCCVDVFIVFDQPHLERVEVKGNRHKVDDRPRLNERLAGEGLGEARLAAVEVRRDAVRRVGRKQRRARWQQQPLHDDVQEAAHCASLLLARPQRAARHATRVRADCGSSKPPLQCIQQPAGAPSVAVIVSAALSTPVLSPVAAAACADIADG
eukprot:125841-Chlamydomonas_euryale.AAC.5